MQSHKIGFYSSPHFEFGFQVVTTLPLSVTYYYFDETPTHQPTATTHSAPSPQRCLWPQGVRACPLRKGLARPPIRRGRCRQRHEAEVFRRHRRVSQRGQDRGTQGPTLKRNRVLMLCSCAHLISYQHSIVYFLFWYFMLLMHA